MKNRIISTLLVVTFSLTVGLSAIANDEVDKVDKTFETVSADEHEASEEFIPMKSAITIKEEVEEAAKKAEKEVERRKAEEEAKRKAEEAKKPKLSSLGTFKLTAYCKCSKCCGKWAGGKTASGTTPTAGRTIAVDTSVIPFGTKVVINGNTYTAEDTGSAIKGNKIDVYFSSHQAALNFGRQSAEVFVYK